MIRSDGDVPDGDGAAVKRGAGIRARRACLWSDKPPGHWRNTWHPAWVRLLCARACVCWKRKHAISRIPTYATKLEKSQITVAARIGNLGKKQPLPKRCVLYMVVCSSAAMISLTIFTVSRELLVFELILVFLLLMVFSTVAFVVVLGVLVIGGDSTMVSRFYSSTTVLVADMSLGEEPAEIFCTRCQQITQTKVTCAPYTALTSCTSCPFEPLVNAPRYPEILYSFWCCPLVTQQ